MPSEYMDTPIDNAILFARIESLIEEYCDLLKKHEKVCEELESYKAKEKANDL